MQAQTLKTWIARRIAVPTRLQQVCVNYLLFLMVATRKRRASFPSYGRMPRFLPTRLRRMMEKMS
jgi:hypothetical protein